MALRKIRSSSIDGPSTASSRTFVRHLAQPPSKITSGGNGVMKLEDQVVSLELATKLAELNVPQTGALVWSRGIRHGNWRVTLAKYWNWPPRYSAYTVAELGKMLPWNGIPHFIVSRYTDGKYNGFLYLARSVCTSMKIVK
jgi:hypothetical protein